jgi:hypothetical protein
MKPGRNFGGVPYVLYWLIGARDHDRIEPKNKPASAAISEIPNRFLEPDDDAFEATLVSICMVKFVGN